MSSALPAPLVPLIHGVAPGVSPVLVPQLGVGTYKVGDAEAERVVSEALALGYRHVDTAQMYGNGRALGAPWRPAGCRARNSSSPPSSTTPTTAARTP